MLPPLSSALASCKPRAHANLGDQGLRARYFFATPFQTRSPCAIRSIRSRPLIQRSFDAMERAPVWIVDSDHWPRAYLRAELIERGYDAEGFVGLADLLVRLALAPARPALVVIDLQGQGRKRRATDSYTSSGRRLPCPGDWRGHGMGGRAPADTPWARFLRRPLPSARSPMRSIGFLPDLRADRGRWHDCCCSTGHEHHRLCDGPLLRIDGRRLEGRGVQQAARASARAVSRLRPAVLPLRPGRDHRQPALIGRGDGGDPSRAAASDGNRRPDLRSARREGRHRPSRPRGRRPAARARNPLAKRGGALLSGQRRRERDPHGPLPGRRDSAGHPGTPGQRHGRTPRSRSWWESTFRRPATPRSPGCGASSNARRATFASSTSTRRRASTSAWASIRPCRSR